MDKQDNGKNQLRGRNRARTALSKMNRNMMRRGKKAKQSALFAVCNKKVLLSSDSWTQPSANHKWK